MKTFCAKVAGRLHTFDFDEKRLALQALQVKIVVGKSGARFQGAIPRNLATIEQTSGCLFTERSALNGLPMDYVFFERLLHLNSGSQAHVITGHPDI